MVVLDDQVIGRGRNSPIERCDPTAHAEILALREACAFTGNYRLERATLYTTLEPCVMCAGALVAARVERVVFGARDLRFGGVRSKFRLADAEVLNHRLVIEEGVLGAECAELMQRFFARAAPVRRETTPPAAPVAESAGAAAAAESHGTPAPSHAPPQTAKDH